MIRSRLSLRYWRLVAWVLRLPPARFATRVERNIAILMDDSVVLHADRYFPVAHGLFPTVLIRSPYGRGSDLPLPLPLLFEMIGRRIAERGYNAVLQTTRGRNDSGGIFDPGIDEATDGLATLNWLEQQPWFDGNLGMLGSSYMGYAQWALATLAPQRVKAIVPAAAGSQLAPIVFADRAVALDTVLRWLLFVKGIDFIRARAWRAAADALIPARQKRLLQPAFSHLPLSEVIPVALGTQPEYAERWLSAASAPSGAPVSTASDFAVANVSAPAHLISGWYDFFLRETLRDYDRLRAAGRAPYLTIGPWRHSSPGLAWRSFCEGMSWFETYLKGACGQLRPAAVRVYVLEARRWLGLAAWPPAYRAQFLYLQERGRLAATPASPAPPDRFYYDPADPTPALGGALLQAKRSRVDNRALEARPDVLCYTGPALTADTTLIGPVRCRLYVHSTCAHTDFFARLCAVYPDGRSMNICDGLLRIVPGTGQRQADNSLLIEVDMWATAILLRKGLRLRLQVSSGAHPRWSRNLGNGEQILAATRMVIAGQAVYHGPEHPSALIIPVFGAKETGGGSLAGQDG